MIAWGHIRVTWRHVRVSRSNVGIVSRGHGHVCWRIDNVNRWRDALSLAVAQQLGLALLCWRVVNVPFLSEHDELHDNFALLGVFVIDVLSDERIEQVVVSVALFHESVFQAQTQHLGHLHELLDV